jgi:flagellar biosynthesis protein FlhG
MFAGACARFVPVVSNPHVACGGVLLERLSTAFAERGARVLVVDAGERAGSPGEMAMIDLGQCVERLTPQVAYLAARGLAIRFVDAAGSTRAFLERAGEAAPGCDVVLVHAPAPELCRMFGRVRGSGALADADLPCPIVVADDRPPSVTHAYASMKLLSQRAGLVVSELLLGAAPGSPRAERIAAKLAACADNFFAGVLRDWARVDPAGDPCDPPSGALRRLVDARFEQHAALRAFSHTAERRTARSVAP